MRAQPRGREGTPERPYSALNLRLALAAFGLIVSIAFAVVAFRGGYALLGSLSVLLAVTAVVDLLVIQFRRSARRRTGRRENPS
jgi:membrane protein YdbS with pleckstrin-like domain